MATLAYRKMTREERNPLALLAAEAFYDYERELNTDYSKTIIRDSLSYHIKPHYAPLLGT